MDQTENSRRVTAIVPAYNEGARLARVLDILTSYPFAEVIVVDDGSRDETGSVARSYPVTYLRNEPNRGKGYSMDRAVATAKTDVIFFCDADIKGLTHEMITEITAPVLRGQFSMFVAMRRHSFYWIPGLWYVMPILGGERALTKKLWRDVPTFYKYRFRIETGLNYYAERYGKGYGFKVFNTLDQYIKEQKHGIVAGFRARVLMCNDVVVAKVTCWKDYLLHLVKVALRGSVS